MQVAGGSLLSTEMRFRQFEKDYEMHPGQTGAVPYRRDSLANESVDDFRQGCLTFARETLVTEFSLETTNTREDLCSTTEEQSNINVLSLTLRMLRFY